MNQVLKKELRNLLLETRERSGLKQKEMAAALMMSETAYSEKERGCNMCGTLTAVLLLARQPDANAILERLQQKLMDAYVQERNCSWQGPLYQVISTSRKIGNNRVLSYGISVLARTESDEKHTIADIATNREEVEELAALCNSLQLDPMHLEYVIEDFLGRV